jgi:hypothetical protein
MVFAAAALGKVRSAKAVHQFADDLKSFTWIPGRHRTAVAIAVPTCETLAVCGLWAAPRWGGLLTLVLLLVFTVETVRTGRMDDCKCFGETPASPHSAVLFLVRNALLASVAVLAALTEPRLPTPPLVVAALLGGGLLGFLVVRADDIAFLLTKPGADVGRS